MPLTAYPKFVDAWRTETSPHAPFAIIASYKAYKPVGDEQCVAGDARQRWEQCGAGEDGAVFGRLYRWGLASCDADSDLRTLRDVLIQQRCFVKELCDSLADQ